MKLVSEVCSLLKAVGDFDPDDIEAYTQSLHQEVATLVFCADSVFDRRGLLSASADTELKGATTARTLATQTLRTMLQQASIDVGGGGGV